MNKPYYEYRVVSRGNSTFLSQSRLVRPRRFLWDQCEDWEDIACTVLTKSMIRHLRDYDPERRDMLLQYSGGIKNNSAVIWSANMNLVVTNLRAAESLIECHKRYIESQEVLSVTYDRWVPQKIKVIRY